MTLGVLPGVMISARLKPLRSIERLREWVKAGARCRSPVNLLTQLLKNQADVLTELVGKSSPQVDKIEDSVLTSRIGTNRAELSTLRRTLVRLQRLLAPEPAALFRLLNQPPGWIGEEDLQDLRQSAEEFATVVGDCAALVERAKLIQEELTAMVNEQTNSSLFLLTFATVMLLPFKRRGWTPRHERRRHTVFGQRGRFLGDHHHRSSADGRAGAPSAHSVSPLMSS